MEELEIGPASAYVAACGAATFVVAGLMIVLFEALVVDIAVVGSWWELPALIGLAASWVAVLVVGAAKLRVDESGLHARTLRRQWSVAWDDLQGLDTRARRGPWPSSVVAVRSRGGWRATPAPVNAHRGGAATVLAAVTPFVPTTEALP